jgi:radical SAM superfamily enzyme YgiQ (UPF0313 family)
MRILLINPPHNSPGWRDVPPLGLAYLTSVLLRHNHKVKILDMHIPMFEELQMVKHFVKAFEPELIGVTSKTYGFNKTLTVVRKVKQARPEVPIVIGGPHASIMRDKLLRDIPELSFVVYGEGEYTLLELCNSMDSNLDFDNILGLIWRKGSAIITNPPRPLNNDLDALPFASESFDVFGFDKYYDSSRALILTSRGCPYSCIYCSVPEIWGRKFRPRSPKNVVDEIQFLYSRYKTRHFHFVDDNFSFDLIRAKRICDEILERNLPITWDLQNGIRADRVDPELLCKMKRAGCRSVFYGLESANQKILDGLQKALKVDTVKKAVKWSKDCGLKVGVFFVVGSPNETFDTVKQSVGLALALDVESVFSILTPYPGTKLWDWVSTNARWTQDPIEYLYSHGHVNQAGIPYETDDFTKKERMKSWKFIEKTVLKKQRQREYEAILKRIYPNFPSVTILKGASILLNTLRGIAFLNRIHQSKVIMKLKRLLILKMH